MRSASQDHALAVRDLVNQMKTSADPNYCQRVTADDGALGEQHLRAFQDSEKTIPTILTTSQKLSTGVDARNVRNIVLMRPIRQMIEFKQIIGRGTRLYEGKDYFTIYDFVKAYEHFSDPKWDGEPMELKDNNAPYKITPPRPPVDVNEPTIERTARPAKIKIKLADGKERAIQHMMITTYWHADGTPMSAQQFMEALYGKIPTSFTTKKSCVKSGAFRTPAKPSSRASPRTASPPKPSPRCRDSSTPRKATSSTSSPTSPTPSRPSPARSAPPAPPCRSRAASTPGRESFSTSSSPTTSASASKKLEQEKLKPLLLLKYHDSLADALDDLGDPGDVGQVFAGFQRYLYEAGSSEGATA